MAGANDEITIDSPQPAGCVLFWDDLPRICASCAVYGSCLAFGAGMALLGAAMPELSHTVEQDTAEIGDLFAYRGVGFLAGTLLTGAVLDVEQKIMSKHLMCALAILVSAVTTWLVPIVAAPTNRAFFVLRILFFLQGAGYGGVDSLSIVAISDMWGQRMQPWMQVKSLMSGLGGIIAPFVLSVFGLNVSFQFSAYLVCTAFAGLFAEALITVLFFKSNIPRNLTRVRSAINVAEKWTDYIMGRVQDEDPLQADELKELNRQLESICEEHDEDYDADAGLTDAAQASNLEMLEHLSSCSVSSYDEGSIFSGNDEKHETNPRIFAASASSAAVLSPTRRRLNELQKQRLAGGYYIGVGASEVSIESAENGIKSNIMEPVSQHSSFSIPDVSDRDMQRSDRCAAGIAANGMTWSDEGDETPSPLIKHLSAVEGPLQLQLDEWMTPPRISEILKQDQQNSPRGKKLQLMLPRQTSDSTEGSFVSCGDSNAKNGKLHRRRRVKRKELVLSYASPRIVQIVEKRSDTGIELTPLAACFVLINFVLWYIGLLITFGGWISAYSIMRGVSSTYSDAAFFTTLFFASSTVGSLASIPAAVYLSTTALLRIELGFLIVGCIVFVFTFRSYWLTCIAVACIGFSLSCIYPLIMTVSNDYGFTMDGRRTVALVIGGNVGESLLPPIVGLLIKHVGTESFPIVTLMISIVMICSYLAVHLMLANREKSVDSKEATRPLLRRRSSSESKYGAVSVAGHISPDAAILMAQPPHNNSSRSVNSVHHANTNRNNINGALSPVQRVLLSNNNLRTERVTRRRSTNKNVYTRVPASEGGSSYKGSLVSMESTWDRITGHHSNRSSPRADTLHAGTAAALAQPPQQSDLEENRRNDKPNDSFRSSEMEMVTMQNGSITSYYQAGDRNCQS